MLKHKIQELVFRSLMKLCSLHPFIFAIVFKLNTSIGDEIDFSPKQVALFSLVAKKTKHIVCLWSRQTAKSTTISMMVVWWLLFGKKERIFVLAPTEEQVTEMYDKISWFIHTHDFIKIYFTKMNSERIVAYNRNFCRFLSASPASHIRGKTATRIIIDESEDVMDEKYYAEILPFVASMKHRDYTILEAGTPKTKNHFYKVLTDPNVTILRQFWYECPFINKEFVMKQKHSMPEMLWRQEYMCDFIEEGSTCFPEKWFVSKKYDETGICVNENNNRKDVELSDIDLLEDYSYFKTIEEISENRDKIKELIKDGACYAMGFDNGRQVDNAALVVLRVDKFPLKIAYIQAFPLGSTTPKLINAIKLAYDTFNINEFNIDWTNEKGFADALKEVGIDLFPKKSMSSTYNKFKNKLKNKDNQKGLISFGTKVKTQMVSNMQTLIQQGLIRFPKKHEVLYLQMINQQFEVVANGYKYYHPTGTHDDLLWALLLAAKNITFYSQDMMNVDFVNIWEEHNKLVGYEKGYNDFVVTNNEALKSRKIGKIGRFKKK